METSKNSTIPIFFWQSDAKLLGEMGKCVGETPQRQSETSPGDGDVDCDGDDGGDGDCDGDDLKQPQILKIGKGEHC